jgi:hypothetical protein
MIVGVPRLPVRGDPAFGAGGYAPGFAGHPRGLQAILRPRTMSTRILQVWTSPLYHRQVNRHPFDAI